MPMEVRILVHFTLALVFECLIYIKQYPANLVTIDETKVPKFLYTPTLKVVERTVNISSATSH